MSFAAASLSTGALGRYFRRTAFRSALAASAACGAGCSGLPAIDAGTCGNHVVEPALGEDCDGADPNGLYACRDPEQSEGCRFACDPHAARDAAGCPPGYGCGVDGVCREPSGRFELVERVPTTPTVNFGVADFDGDGRRDLVRSTASGIEAQFFTGGLTRDKVLSLPGAGAQIYDTGDFVAADGRADLVLGLAQGVEGALGMFRGELDRTLGAVSFPFASTGATTARLVALHVHAPFTEHQALGWFDTRLIGYDDAAGHALVDLGPSGFDARDLAAVAVSDLREDAVDSPCDEVAYALVGASEVALLEPCDATGWNLSALPPVALGGSHVRGLADARGQMRDAALMLLDMNGDGHRDLVVATLSASDTPEVRVAYGVGDGTFHSDPSVPVPGPGDGMVAAAPLVIDVGGVCAAVSEPRACSRGCLGDDVCAPGANECPGRVRAPLASADFNGDGRPDFVSADGVFLSSTAGGAAFFAEACSLGVAEAVAGDFDGNGSADFVSVVPGFAGVFFDRGTGDGAFAAAILPARRTPSLLTRGDFDGDALDDLAFVEAAPADQYGDSVRVAFGATTGTPLAPIDVAKLPTVVALPTGRWLGHDAPYDLIPLASVTPGSEALLSFVTGGAGRQLQSAFLFRVADASGSAEARALTLVSGNFLPATSGPALPGVAVVTADVGSSGAPDGPVRVWLAAYDSDVAFLDANRGPSSEGPTTGLACAGCALAAVDLDADGSDELVSFEAGTLTVFHVTSAHEPPSPVLEPAPPVPTPLPLPEQLLAPRPAVADVDGDGRKDVVLVTDDQHIWILWNDGTGSLDATSAATLPGTSFALVALGGGPGLAIVAVAPLTSAVYHLLPGTRSFDAGEPLGLADLSYAGLGSDLDGDGVDDLVLGDLGGYTLLRGLPVKP